MLYEVITKINIEEAQKFELKNGLKVFVVENHKNPIVSYSLSLDLDPIVEGDKAGYIEMAGDLLGAGTSNRSKAELDEAIDFIGATLNTSPSGIYASSLKKHSEEVLELLTDVLYNPIFVITSYSIHYTKLYDLLRGLVYYRALM